MKRSDFGFFQPLRVRYSEVDGQGVVYNAHYLTYFDVAITEYLRHIGYNHRESVKGTGQDYHLVKALAEYKAPINYDDELEVHCRVGRLGRSSMTFDLAIFRRGQDQLLSTGEIVWVNADQATRSAVPVPRRLAGLIRDKEGVRLA